MPKATSKEYEALRKFGMRGDASVYVTEEEIERVFKLPRGSVNLHLPSGRRARTDKTIAALRSDWSEDALRKA